MRETALASWDAVVEPVALPPMLTLMASLPLTPLAWTKAETMSGTDRAVAVDVVSAEADRLMSSPPVIVLLSRP